MNINDRGPWFLGGWMDGCTDGRMNGYEMGGYTPEVKSNSEGETTSIQQVSLYIRERLSTLCCDSVIQSIIYIFVLIGT